MTSKPNPFKKPYYEEESDEEYELEKSYNEYMERKNPKQSGAPQSRDEQLERYRKEKKMRELTKKLRKENDMKELEDTREEKNKESVFQRYDALRFLEIDWIRKFPCVSESFILSSLPLGVSTLLKYRSLPKGSEKRLARSLRVGYLAYFVSLPFIFTGLFLRYSSRAHKVLPGEPEDFSFVYVSEEGVMNEENYESVRAVGPDAGIVGDPVTYPKGLNDLRRRIKSKNKEKDE